MRIAAFLRVSPFGWCVRLLLCRQGKRAEHATQAILGEIMAAPTTARESLSSLQPPADALPEQDGERGSDLSGSEEGVESQSCDGERDGGAVEEVEDGNGGEHEAMPDGASKTNGEPLLDCALSAPLSFEFYSREGAANKGYLQGGVSPATRVHRAI